MTIKQAEAIIVEQLDRAFADVQSIDAAFEFIAWQDIPDTWVQENLRLFAYYDHDDALFLLPAFLRYLLCHIDNQSNAALWLDIEGTLREYGKQKQPQTLKHQLTNAQFAAIKAFIKHVAYNKSPSFDKQAWLKLLKNWKR